jgi:hypothetical protein
MKREDEDSGPWLNLKGAQIVTGAQQAGVPVALFHERRARPEVDGLILALSDEVAEWRRPLPQASGASGRVETVLIMSERRDYSAGNLIVSKLRPGFAAPTHESRHRL